MNSEYFRSDLPVRYTTAATMARSILDREILRHIDSSLTVKGMKTKMTKRGGHQKRRDHLQDVKSTEEECQVNRQFPFMKYSSTLAGGLD